MTAGAVLDVLDALGSAGLDVWVDGGWGVDALVGEQTRPHEDLDLVVARSDVPRAEAALRPLGFAPAAGEEPGLPARLVLRAPTVARWTCTRSFSTRRGTGARTWVTGPPASTPPPVSPGVGGSRDAPSPA